MKSFTRGPLWGPKPSALLSACVKNTPVAWGESSEGRFQVWAFESKSTQNPRQRSLNWSRDQSTSEWGQASTAPLFVRSLHAIADAFTSPSLLDFPLTFSRSLDPEFAPKPCEICVILHYCCSTAHWRKWYFRKVYLALGWHWGEPFQEQRLKGLDIKFCNSSHVNGEKMEAKDFQKGPLARETRPCVGTIQRSEVSATIVFNSAMFMKTGTWNLRFWHQKCFEF